MIRQRPIPLDWFVCPITKGPLVPTADALSSSAGNYRYVRPAGYWDFMPASLVELEQPAWKTWEQLQNNGVVSYQADPEHNLGVGKREDFLKFGEFCGFKGNVLDIGVGPQLCPTHIEYCDNPNVFFVGVDPLVGDQPRRFPFVRALGEYLPFRRDIFDQVLFVTSLDHFIDPRAPLREAARVLRRDGHICVWIGSKDKSAPRPEVSNKWYEELQIPNGADDRFHFKRFTADQFEGFLRELGLIVVDKAIAQRSPWRQDIFYRMRTKS